MQISKCFNFYYIQIRILAHTKMRIISPRTERKNPLQREIRGIRKKYI